MGSRSEPVLVSPGLAGRLFHFVMIKPTHYDDDGYPILWYRSAIPSNTLACLNGLAEDAHRRNVLGPDVEIRLHTYDETNRRVQPERIIREIRNAGGKALIGLVGVQSNQFPRAVDLARPFLAAGLPVCIGGFHISGCIAMLPEMPPDMREAQALGISFFAGEAEEGRFDAVLRDAWEGKLAPLYNHMDKLPNLQGQPPPILPRKHVRRTSGSLSSMDLGRGCPYQCSFCTIINVQGRKSRFRSPDDLEKIIRENYAQNIRRFFITDDNFARNRDWELLFDRLIELRAGDCSKIGFTIQVDTLCHKIPNFIEKDGRAGVRRVFIGLENINPDNLIAAKKRQNKITDYREMLQKWRDHGAITYAGYILGFPGDTKQSIQNATLRSSSGNCRSTSWKSSSSLRCPDRRTTRFSGRTGPGWIPTSTSTTSIIAWRTIRKCRMRNGRMRIAPPGRPYMPEHIRTIRNAPPPPALAVPTRKLTTLLWFQLVIHTKEFIHSKAGHFGEDPAATAAMACRGRTHSYFIRAILGRGS